MSVPAGVPYKVCVWQNPDLFERVKRQLVKGVAAVNSANTLLRVLEWQGPGEICLLYNLMI